MCVCVCVYVCVCVCMCVSPSMWRIIPAGFPGSCRPTDSMDVAFYVARHRQVDHLAGIHTTTIYCLSGNCTTLTQRIFITLTCQITTRHSHNKYLLPVTTLAQKPFITCQVIMITTVIIINDDHFNDQIYLGSMVLPRGEHWNIDIMTANDPPHQQTTSKLR